MKRTNAYRRGGFTLVELMISVVLLGLVLGTLGIVGLAGDRAYRTSSVKTQLESQAVAALEHALEDLRLAVDETVQPVLDEDEMTSELTYARADDLIGTALVLSEPCRLAFEYEVGEVDDGEDNNGNGLIDEGRVVLTKNLGTPAEQRLVLTRWVRELQGDEEPNGSDDDGDGLVDEPGFLVRRTGRTLTIELTLERLDHEGRPLKRSTRSSTKLRN